jgi:hypothetical protein
MVSFLNFVFHQQYGPRYWGDDVKEDEMGGVCTTVWAEDLKKGTMSES